VFWHDIETITADKKVKWYTYKLSACAIIL